jgi:hypothetical protein
MEHDSLEDENVCLDFIMTTRNKLTAATWHVRFGVHITYESTTMHCLSSESTRIFVDRNGSTHEQGTYV